MRNCAHVLKRSPRAPDSPAPSRERRERRKESECWKRSINKYLTRKDPNSLSGFQPEIFQGLPKFSTKANDSQLCRPWTNFGLASHRVTNETDPFLCLAGPTKIRDLDRVLNCSVPVAGSSAPVLFYPCSCYPSLSPHSAFVCHYWKTGAASVWVCRWCKAGPAPRAVHRPRRLPPRGWWRPIPRNSLPIHVSARLLIFHEWWVVHVYFLCCYFLWSMFLSFWSLK